MHNDTAAAASTNDSQTLNHIRQLLQNSFSNKKDEEEEEQEQEELAYATLMKKNAYLRKLLLENKKLELSLEKKKMEQDIEIKKLQLEQEQLFGKTNTAHPQIFAYCFTIIFILYCAALICAL